MATSPASLQATAVKAPPETGLGQRYLALDSMRGMVMLLLVSHFLGLGDLKDPNLKWLADQFEHLKWEGFVPWEMIMPAFMFMIGVAMPFALARRRAAGAGFSRNLRNALGRTFRLVLLGQFLTCVHRNRWAYEPYETLTQLGLSYLLAFLILHLPWRWQPVAAAGSLLANLGLYVIFPGSTGPFAPNDNIGVVIDKAVFHLNHAGSWATINFLGSGITVLFGAWTGSLVMSQRPPAAKLKVLGGAAAASFVLCAAFTPFIPIIHKAWSLTFTFIHTGILLVAVMLFYWVFDLKGCKRLAFPLMVVGVNSIFIYMLAQLFRGWLNRTVTVFTGGFTLLGPFAPAVQACAVALVMWYACYWCYKRKIFFKV
ncbi:MAG: hypothetical protein ACE15B_07460 [Bryobacteraceae bacterium]